MDERVALRLYNPKYRIDFIVAKLLHFLFEIAYINLWIYRNQYWNHMVCLYVD